MSSCPYYGVKVHPAPPRDSEVPIYFAHGDTNGPEPKLWVTPLVVLSHFIAMSLSFLLSEHHLVHSSERKNLRVVRLFWTVKNIPESADRQVGMKGNKEWKYE